MELIICCRATIDYLDKKIPLSFAPAQAWGQIKQNGIYEREKARETKLRESVEEWDEKNRLSFREYRHALKNIAQDSWEQTGAVILYPKDLDELERELKRFDDYLIVPVDDDDWFSPDIKEVGQVKADIALWNNGVLSTLDKPQFLIRNKNPIESNSYGITKRGWDKLRTSDKLRAFYIHTEVLRVGRKYRLIGQVFNTPLSAFNLHRGCSHLLSKERYQNRLSSDIMVDFPAWVEPYLERLLEVYNQLETK